MNIDQFNLDIDELALDREWMQQGKRYFRATQGYADARRTLDEAKAELEVVRAELSKDIRLRPNIYGVQKITEDAVAQTVPLQTEYKQAQKSVIEAQHDTNIYHGFVTAMEQRKTALENLVKLHLAGYFAGPRAPEGSEEQVKEMEDNYIRRRVGVCDV